MIWTVDLNREYHPYGLLITKTEDHDDYEYMFKKLKDITQTIGAVDFNLSRVGKRGSLLSRLKISSNILANNGFLLKEMVGMTITAIIVHAKKIHLNQPIDISKTRAL